MKNYYLKSKRWCTNLLFLFSALFLCIPLGYSQIVTQGAAVKANFGIDADIYANQLRVFTGTFVANTDDWFKNLDNFYGIGKGVIDDTGWESEKLAIQADNNYSFEKRMSENQNSVWNGIVWIDAVYLRDNNSQQGNSDATVFTSGSNKNGDNPQTWSLGSGGTPQKNDLVDVMGHMRQDSNGDVYGIGAFTTISSDGNSHADFEFFANMLEFNGSLSGLGTDGGHTAWKFDSDGELKSAGDLIVSIDFENGGTKPLAQVRVWISQADFNTWYNNPSLVPFSLTGTFDSGTGADGFGYAGIEVPDESAEASVWAIVNTDEATLGAPWGSLEGPQAKFYEDMQLLQYTEFAINLTSLGLAFGGTDPCKKTLGSLFVKTRSSSSFTAELKDFGGPFLFGWDFDATVEVINLSNCEDGNNEFEFDLNDAVTSQDGTISFYENENDADNGTNAISETQTVTVVESPKTFWVRSENDINPDCNDVKSFTVTVFDNPVCSFPEEGVNYGNVTIKGGSDGWAEPKVEGGTSHYKYTWSTLTESASIPLGEEDDARADGLTAGGYRVDIEDANGCTTWCEISIDEPQAFCDITVEGKEICEPGGPVELCAVAAEGTEFDPELTTFYWYDADPENNLVPVGDPVVTTNDPCNTFNVTETTTYWLIMNNQGCISEIQMATITVNPIPVLTNATDEFCEDDQTQTTLADYNTAIGAVAGETVVWYSDADRTVEVTVTGDLAVGDHIFYATVTKDDDTGCDADAMLTITINPIPVLTNATDEFCEDDQTQTTLADYNTAIGAVAGEIVVWYSDADRTVEVTVTGDLAVGDHIFYATVTKDDDTGCDADAMLTITINPSPELTVADLEECSTDEAGTLAQFDLTAEVTYSGGTVAYSSSVNGALTEGLADYTGTNGEVITVTVTSDDYCVTEKTFTLTVNPTPSCYIADIVDASCDLSVGGSATVYPSGGTPDYTYLWSDGQTAATATDLAPGVHTVVVTDANGCTTECEVTIYRTPEEFVCETAFAKVDDAQCFIPDFDRWGWTNLISETETSEKIVMPLWSGAGQCDTDKGSHVGDAFVTYYNGTVSVEYVMFEGFVLKEAHVYVGTTKYPMVTRGKKSEPTVAPGQYNYNSGPLDDVDGLTDIVFEGLNGGDVYVIIHGVACEAVCMWDEPESLAVGFYQNLAPKGKKIAEIIPSAFVSGNLNVYPNPFSERVTFEFVSAKDARAQLEITNVLGQRIAVLMNENVRKGVMHRVEYTPVDVVSGILIYRLILDDDISTGRLIYKE